LASPSLSVAERAETAFRIEPINSSASAGFRGWRGSSIANCKRAGKAADKFAEKKFRPLYMFAATDRASKFALLEQHERTAPRTDSSRQFLTSSKKLLCEHATGKQKAITCSLKEYKVAR